MTGGLLSCRACLLRTIQQTANLSAVETPIFRAFAPVSQQNRARTFATASAATSQPVDAPRGLQVRNDDSPAAEKKKREQLQRAVKKQLSYMEDPYKIAQHVEQTLAKGQFDEAVLLTQRASKDRQVVVAWNHLIGYQLEKQQLKKAIKLYNDVGFLTVDSAKATANKIGIYR